MIDAGELDELTAVIAARRRDLRVTTALRHGHPLVGVTVTWVRTGGIVEGCTAVVSSIDRTRNACRPFGRCSTSQITRAPS